MDDLKIIFAGNLIALRTKANMTQAELAERIHYSDKSVSKWERAEGLPDVVVMKSLSEIFGVSVDYLLASHDQWTLSPEMQKAQRSFDEKMVASVAVIGTLTLAALIFVIFWLLGNPQWIIFIIAIPVSLIALLVLNSLWNDGRGNMFIVLTIVLCIFALVYYIFRSATPWQLIFVLLPAELLVALCYQIRKRPKKRDDPS